MKAEESKKAKQKIVYTYQWAFKVYPNDGNYKSRTDKTDDWQYYDPLLND